jgi:hypothetical protein
MVPPREMATLVFFYLKGHMGWLGPSGAGPAGDGPIGRRAAEPSQARRSLAFLVSVLDTGDLHACAGADIRHRRV